MLNLSIYVITLPACIFLTFELVRCILLYKAYKTEIFLKGNNIFTESKLKRGLFDGPLTNLMIALNLKSICYIVE